jgi:hypothetical protein
VFGISARVMDLQSRGVGSGGEEGWLGGSSSSGRLSLTCVVVESSQRSRPVVDVSGSVHVDDSRSFVVDVSRSVGGGKGSLIDGKVSGK